MKTKISQTESKKTILSIVGFLKASIEKNSTVIMGISGGPDSVFLFNICNSIQKEHPFNIVVAHVNHNLRGKESTGDEKFVKGLAKKNDCDFESISVSKPQNGNLEDRLREIRYGFFKKLQKKYGADWILTAHHLNDSIETIFHNLTRGAFIDGLGGISLKDEERHLLRPLVAITKDEIIKYLKRKKIRYRLDVSNNNKNYSRNLIRHEVIPSLKKINRNLEKTMLQNIHNIRELQKDLNNETANWIRNNSNENGIKTTPFLKLSKFRQKNILFFIYKNIYGNHRNLSQNHIEQLIKIITKNQANRKKEFGSKCTLAISKQFKDKNRYIQILKK